MAVVCNDTLCDGGNSRRRSKNHEVAMAGQKFLHVPAFGRGDQRKDWAGLIGVVRILTFTRVLTCSSVPIRDDGGGAASWLTDLDLAGSLHSPLRDMQNPHQTRVWTLHTGSLKPKDKQK